MDTLHAITILLIITITTINQTTSFECIRLSNCICIDNFKSYEIVCPPEEQEIKIDINDSIIEIECDFAQNDSSQYLKFPKLNLTQDYVKLNYCPQPSENFNEIFELFNLKSIKTFKFQNMNDDNPKRLNKNYFKESNDLEILYFINNKIDHLNDLFDYLVNLKELYLNENELKEMRGNVFKHNEKLKILELSNNKIEIIDDKTFHPLKNLEILHLYVNNIKNLTNALLFKECRSLKTIEMSFNPIIDISENLFYFNSNLTTVSLRGTELKELPNDLFKMNKQLEYIYIGGNNVNYLPNNLITNLTNLKEIFMEKCQLLEIPDEFFLGCVNLNKILLFNNNLTRLNDAVFRNLKKLTHLDLSYNYIDTLSDDVFKDLISLQTLNLENNRLEEINGVLLQNLERLKELNLNDNRIAFLNNRSFSSLSNLEILKLSKNMITSVEDRNIVVHNCINLKQLYFDNNRITEYEDWSHNLVYLEKIDLKHNNISTLHVGNLQFLSESVEIDLQYNNIKTINFTDYNFIFENTDANYKINLTHNQIICDGELYDFVKYLQEDNKYLQITDELYCNEPETMKGVPLKKIDLNDLLVKENTCPKACDCYWRRHDRSYVVDCSYRNLTEIPNLTTPHLSFNQSDVKLNGNYLTTAPTSLNLGYLNVTKLNLGENYIKNLTWVPPHIQVLILSKNKLQRMDGTILGMLNKTKSLVHLNFQNNPWMCDCETSNFTNFLRQHLLYKQLDAKNVTCYNNNQLLVNLNSKNLCKNPTQLVLILGLIILFIFIIVLLLLTLYYRYQLEIKIWLYAHNMLLWFVTEEEIDKDKLYDAFISYSHKDEQFVTEKLLPVLENGPKPYKLCVHYRDFIGGEFISTQIVNSIKDSRRTIIVLSEHFLKSVWGKMEFRTAHQNALSEGLTRVIIIIYGDIDPKEIADEELKAYLSTNTYVKWDDPWFWNKLKYALPHSNKKLEKRNKHLEDVFTKIDKLDLIYNQPTTPNIGTTPPVEIMLNPLLLKNKEVNFNNTHNEIGNTTPIEENNRQV